MGAPDNRIELISVLASRSAMNTFSIGIPDRGASGFQAGRVNRRCGGLAEWLQKRRWRDGRAQPSIHL